MNIINVTDKDKINLVDDLSNALIKYSNGKLDKIQADQLAKIAISKIDFNNSSLTHKGINWYARRVINTVDINKLVVTI